MSRKTSLVLCVVGSVLLLVCLPLLLSPLRPFAQSPPPVVINEIAWGGTVADYHDEWIELYNNTTQPVTLTGWSLVADDGTPDIDLSGVIPPEGYFLLERTDDSTVSDIPADLFYTGGMNNDGETLWLFDAGDTLIDTANQAGGAWPAGSGAPTYLSMERVDPLAADVPASWVSNNGVTRNGLDADGNPINGTPGQPNSATTPITPTPTLTPTATLPPTPPPALLISEFLYDATTPQTGGDEFVELCNADTLSIDLTNFKVGDEETSGGNEGMYYLPDGQILAPDECLVIAKNAAQFRARFGFDPHFELIASGSGYSDTLAVPELSRYTAWGRGRWGLNDNGDELLVLDPFDQLVDGVAYGNGDYAAVGVAASAVSASKPDSLQRVWPFDSDSMPADFVRKAPSPGRNTPLPAPPASSPPAADLPDGMHAYWGILHSHSSYSDGAGPPPLAFATARSNGLHFLALTDHDGWLSDAEWAEIGAWAAGADAPGEFVALRGYEYTHPTDGHLTVWNTASFASRDDPLYDTLPEFYDWLAAQPDALAEFNHPFADSDFHDFAYEASVASNITLLEVGNGSERYGQYFTFEEQWMQALAAGWKVAPANNSDSENAYWGADTVHRTGLVAPALTQTDLLEAIRARRAFATEDSNLALTLRCNNAWMGSVVSETGVLTFTVNALDLDPFSEAITLTLYDRTLPIATQSFAAPPAEWEVTIPGKPGHFYWARGLQADGDVAQTAPIWTEGNAAGETIVINEILPAPYALDWDGDGNADYQDEWIELYNPDNVAVGVGGWQVGDASGTSYLIPLGTILNPGDYLVVYHRQSGLPLNNDADTVTLRRPDGTLADQHRYPDGPGYDVSLCRLPDGDGGWVNRCDPTPGGSNRVLPAAGPSETTIFEARHMPLDSWVKLQGQVTVPPGVFSQRTAYIQDKTGGIKVYLPKDKHLSADLGDRVEVTGNTHQYHGELEIKVSSLDDVRLLGRGNPLPPLPIGTGVMVEPYEGTLVLLYGWAVDFERGGHFSVDDGTGWARIYLDPDTDINRPWMEVGQTVQAVGVVSQYLDDHSPDGGYRLMPRYSFDLVISQPISTTTVAWPLLLPETGGR